MSQKPSRVSSWKCVVNYVASRVNTGEVYKNIKQLLSEKFKGKISLSDQINYEPGIGSNFNGSFFSFQLNINAESLMADIVDNLISDLSMQNGYHSQSNSFNYSLICQIFDALPSQTGSNANSNIDSQAIEQLKKQIAEKDETLKQLNTLIDEQTSELEDYKNKEKQVQQIFTDIKSNIKEILGNQSEAKNSQESIKKLLTCLEQSNIKYEQIIKQSRTTTGLTRSLDSTLTSTRSGTLSNGNIDSKSSLDQIKKAIAEIENSIKSISTSLEDNQNSPEKQQQEKKSALPKGKEQSNSQFLSQITNQKNLRN